MSSIHFYGLFKFDLALLKTGRYGKRFKSNIQQKESNFMNVMIRMQNVPHRLK